MSYAKEVIRQHLLDGKLQHGSEIGVKIDQTLTQDATGTLVMLELEALRIKDLKTEVSVQYVDHNLIQQDFKNADDHRFLASACRKYGIYYSPPGAGISHVLHQEFFGFPGKTLLGSDSHTCAGGGLGMLAFGAGGLEVALAMIGEPYYFKMPKIIGVELVGELEEWVSAKDVALNQLRTLGVRGGLGCIFEFFGEGVSHLGIMDRHVIANMGAETGATTTVFPPDDVTEEFLGNRNGGKTGQTHTAEYEQDYDDIIKVDLSKIEPLIAKPSSPGNVVPVSEVAGQTIHQSYVGSSANPGFRDYGIVAEMIAQGGIAEHVSLDVNPSSNFCLSDLIEESYLSTLVKAGARIHQTGCNGCIGMGQAPASDSISLRTVPRNFPGRSGTVEDQVYLVSPETAAASAVTGKITDPRKCDLDWKAITEPRGSRQHHAPFKPRKRKGGNELVKGPNISTLPEFEGLPDQMSLELALVLGDDVSTDEILPAGLRVLPYRSNIEKISEFLFADLAPRYGKRYCPEKGAERTPHLIIAGENYGQGSSREHAALCPRFLGLRAVVATSFARIHKKNLINFGVLPLSTGADLSSLKEASTFKLRNLSRERIRANDVELSQDDGQCHRLQHDLSERDIEVICAGGIINYLNENNGR